MRFFLLLFAAFTFFGTIHADWTTPVDLSLTGQNASNPQLSCDSLGNALAVWERNGIIQASFYDGTIWSTPEDLSGTLSSFPQVCLNDSGQAVAVWQHNNGANTIIQASIYDGTSWSSPEDLSATLQNASNPQVSCNNSGEYLAVWQRFDGANDIIQASFYDGIIWSTTNISSSGFNSTIPQVSLNDSSQGVAVWVFDEGGGSNIIQAATFNGTFWSSPEQLSPSGVGNLPYDPDVSINNSGEAVAIWAFYDSTDTFTQVSIYNGTSWSTPPTTLSSAATDIFNPHVSLNDLGNAIAIWSFFDGTDVFIQTSIYDGISWSAPEDISGALTNAAESQISLNKSGNAVAIWTFFNGATGIIQASIYDGTSWSTAVDISDSSQSATSPQVCLSDSEEIVAVWSRSNGSNTIIQASTNSSLVPPVPPIPPVPPVVPPTAPTNFSGRIRKDKFLTEIDVINVLTWTPANDSTIIGYRIYSGGILLATTSSSGPFKVTLHNRIKRSYEYTLVSFDSSGAESTSVYLTVTR